jgi:hypothetical protein
MYTVFIFIKLQCFVSAFLNVLFTPSNSEANTERETEKQHHGEQDVANDDLPKHERENEFVAPVFWFVQRRFEFWDSNPKQPEVSKYEPNTQKQRETNMCYFCHC